MEQFLIYMKGMLIRVWMAHVTGGYVTRAGGKNPTEEKQAKEPLQFLFSDDHAQANTAPH